MTKILNRIMVSLSVLLLLLSPTCIFAKDITVSKVLLAYTATIDNITPKYLPKGSGVAATVTFTIRPAKYSPKTVELKVGTDIIELTGVSGGGTYTVDLFEGADLTEVGDYAIRIRVDNYTTTPETITVWKVYSWTEATIPSDRERKNIGIGENVDLMIYPIGIPETVGWTLTGAGSIDKQTGNTTRLSASQTPATSKVEAEIDGRKYATMFSVLVPLTITAVKKSDIGFGQTGNNQIGAYTTCTVTVGPTTVSFYRANFRENIAMQSWTWPNGTTGGISAQTPTWPVNEANQITDNISSGPYPIGRIYNGIQYVDFGYTVEWKEEYKNQSDTWIEWIQRETTLTEYRGLDQKARQTYMGVPGGWQGPWQ